MISILTLYVLWQPLLFSNNDLTSLQHQHIFLLLVFFSKFLDVDFRFACEMGQWFVKAFCTAYLHKVTVLLLFKFLLKCKHTKSPYWLWFQKTNLHQFENASILAIASHCNQAYQATFAGIQIYLKSTQKKNLLVWWVFI